jgi:hypothetical protein
MHNSHAEKLDRLQENSEGNPQEQGIEIRYKERNGSNNQHKMSINKWKEIRYQKPIFVAIGYNSVRTSSILMDQVWGQIQDCDGKRGAVTIMSGESQLGD